MMRARALLGSLIASALIALTPRRRRPLGARAPGTAPKGGLDCNGFSPVQTTYRQLWCTEIAANDENGFEDNGHYVGHDEPDIGFFSFQRGSSNDMTYHTVFRSTRHPAVDGVRRIDARIQLTPAIWFGLTMCDTESYPEGSKVCKRDSDSNVQVPPRPNHAGAAFMELQMYPPGFAPAISCDQTHWCAALTIDSLQADYGALHDPAPSSRRSVQPQLLRAGQLRVSDPQRSPGGPPDPISRPTRRSPRPPTSC